MYPVTEFQPCGPRGMRWAGMAGLVFIGGCLMGCASTGHRVVKVTLFGSVFSWEDQTYLNEKGETKWTSDVIAGSSLTEWAFGKTEPKDGVGDGPTPKKETIDDLSVD